MPALKCLAMWPASHSRPQFRPLPRGPQRSFQSFHDSPYSSICAACFLFFFFRSIHISIQDLYWRVTILKMITKWFLGKVHGVVAGRAILRFAQEHRKRVPHRTMLYSLKQVVNDVVSQGTIKCHLTNGPQNGLLGMLTKPFDS